MGRIIFEMGYNQSKKSWGKGKNNKSQQINDEPHIHSKQYRQFMVSRNHHLEVLYTNGLIYWTEKV